MNQGDMMANAALDDKLSGQVMALFDRPDKGSFYYGEAMLVLEYAWHQYLDARKRRDESYVLSPLPQGEDLVALQREYMRDERYLESPHIDVARVDGNCSALYTMLKDLLDPAKLPVNIKYHAVDTALKSINAGFADTHPGKNPFMVMISGADRWHGG